MTRIMNITTMVAEHHCLTVEILRGPNRSLRFVRPRFEAMSLVREYTSASFPAIGIFFGGRDHSSVINAIKRCAEFEREDAPTRERMNEFRRRLEIEQRKYVPTFRSVRGRQNFQTARL